MDNTGINRYQALNISKDGSIRHIGYKSSDVSKITDTIFVKQANSRTSKTVDKISVEEYTARIAKTLETNGIACYSDEFAKENIKAFDRDGDGFLSKDEVKAHLAYADYENGTFDSKIDLSKLQGKIDENRYKESSIAFSAFSGKELKLPEEKTTITQTTKEIIKETKDEITDKYIKAVNDEKEAILALEKAKSKGAPDEEIAKIEAAKEKAGLEVNKLYEKYTEVKSNNTDKKPAKTKPTETLSKAIVEAQKKAEKDKENKIAALVARGIDVKAATAKVEADIKKENEELLKETSDSKPTDETKPAEQTRESIIAEAKKKAKLNEANAIARYIELGMTDDEAIEAVKKDKIAAQEANRKFLESLTQKQNQTILPSLNQSQTILPSQSIDFKSLLGQYSQMFNFGMNPAIAYGAMGGTSDVFMPFAQYGSTNIPYATPTAFHNVSGSSYAGGSGGYGGFCGFPSLGGGYYGGASNLYSGTSDGMAMMTLGSNTMLGALNSYLGYRTAR